jgi:hypothetical protein
VPRPRRKSLIAEKRLRRFNQRIRALSDEQKQTRAQAMYERNFRRMAPILGAEGQPAPLLRFAPGEIPNQQVGIARAQVEAGPDGNRQMTVGRQMMKEMIYKSRQRKFGPRFRAKRTAAHETAHVYQRPELFFESRDLPHDEQPIEQGAERFADAAMAPVQRQIAISRAKKRGNRARVKRLRARPLPAPDTSQFGNNYGQDPRTITWPTSQ